ncbi:MAG: hypothetical protein ACE5E8_09900 [Acidimicrobiia bacterium]
MDLDSALTEFEGHLANQLALAQHARDVSVESLVAALRPAVQGLAVGIAGQVAGEFIAQAPEYDVEVVVVDGQPGIRARLAPPDIDAGDDVEARLTLRLPASLKGIIEEAAREAGDSLNSFVVKSLSSRSRGGRGRGHRVTGKLRT